MGFTQFYPWVKLTVLPSFTQFFTQLVLPIGKKCSCQPCYHNKKLPSKQLTSVSHST